MVEKMLITYIPQAIKAVLLITALIFNSSCTTTLPQHTKVKSIKNSFKNSRELSASQYRSLDIEKIESIESMNSFTEKYLSTRKLVIDRGFSKTPYSISYNIDAYCVNFYDVFEKCNTINCEYAFIETIGLCQ
jgi:hypothetical protein